MPLLNDSVLDIFGFVSNVICLLIGTDYSSVPITHRKQVNLVSEYEMIQNGKIAYDSFLTENQVLSPYHQKSILVKKVGENLQNACYTFLQDHGDVSRIAGYEWEFNVVENSEENAWCMPGGKVVVYTGLFNKISNEEELAVILSHEIAHAVARHGSERVSQQIIFENGGDILASVLGSIETNGLNLEGLINQTWNVGSNVGMLKFSRNHEEEADKMGLVFMEYAGYDCFTAVSFWDSFQGSQISSGPEFLQTHPASKSRVQYIEEFIPVAKSYKK